MRPRSSPPARSAGSGDHLGDARLQGRLRRPWRAVGGAPGRAPRAQRALAAARHAFEQGPWPGRSGKARARDITRIADLLRKRQDDLVELVIAETGCGRAMAETIQVGWPIQSLYGWADYAALPDFEP